MAMSEQELAAIVDAVQKRIDFAVGEAEGRIKAYYQTALQGEITNLATEFTERMQQLGDNQQTLYAMMAEGLNPATMVGLSHDFWVRSILNESERIRAEVEAEVAVRQGYQPDPLVMEDDPELERILAEEVAIEEAAVNSREEACHICHGEPKHSACPECGQEPFKASVPKTKPVVQ